MSSKQTLKRKSMSIEEKGVIIARMENGETNANLSSEFGVSHSTISSIWKNREKITDAFNSNALRVKKLRSTQHDDLDKSLLEWFKIQRSRNVPITGPILRQKADEFALLLGKSDFQCSEGWINRFKVRHSIVFGKISGEAASVPAGVSESWLQSVFPEIRKGYTDEEIFNADETGLFYKMTYDKTMKFKGDKCIGGKMSKERITVLVAANMTGSEKSKLLVIGKAKQPRCFKNITVKNLPVIYEHNKRAWMTSELFTKLVRNWDNNLKQSGKKILLIVDNCPAHPRIEGLKVIKLCFLPPNCTSVLQPMDQGVINSLKAHYRKLQITETIKNIELKKECGITLLDAILMVSAAWEAVTAKTIIGCFSHAGFTTPSNEYNLAEENTSFDEEDYIPLAQLVSTTTGKTVTSDEVLDFVNIDKDLETCNSLKESDIVKHLFSGANGETEDNADEEEEENIDVPSCAEALDAVTTLKRFFIFTGTSENRLSESIAILDNKIQHLYCQTKCNKQSQITDFFSAN